jgi:hypothetical protein
VAIPSYNDNSVRLAIQDFKLHAEALQEQALAAATAAASGTDDGGNNNSTIRKPSMNVRPSIMLQNMACQRNKRGLLLYHSVRMQRIQELLYWQSGVGTTSSDALTNKTNDNYPMDDIGVATTNNSSNDTEVLKNLCPSEKEFLYNYQQLIYDYMNEQQLMTDTSIVDLRAHCTIPPITVDRIVCRVVDTKPFMSSVANDNDENDPDSRDMKSANAIVLESGQCVNFTLGSTHYLIYSDVEEYIRCGALQVVEIEET